ncbi:MAG: hypothetical protein U1E06_19620 [Tabrizicola sp.]|nr:hypothetical protein [Tabrizicola sp.]
MTTWVNFLCDLPDDDGATMETIIASMPLGSAFRLTHYPVCYRLRLSSPGTALALCLAVPSLSQLEGITADAEVLVHDEARAVCDRWLDEISSEPGRWTRLEHVEARIDVWSSFETRWRQAVVHDQTA